MILEGIIKEMAIQVHGLGFVSKSGGILVEMNSTAGDGEAILTSAQVAPFTTTKLFDVSPHNTETGTSFFRVGPTRITNQDLYMSTRQNEVVFTCWVNGDRVKTNDTDIEEQVVKALRNYRSPRPSGGPLRAVSIQYDGDNTGESINRWGWEKKTLRYNEPPHLLFQQRFTITYVVSTGCYSQTVQVVNPAC